MIIQIQATAVALTANEIREAIPQEVMAEIKTKNPNPYFQAYSLIQEGESRPKEVGAIENQLIIWTKAAVQSAKNVLKKGLQFFKFHGPDNSTNNRPSLGDYVGRIGKEIKGRLHEIVIGYFPNKVAAQECDICSVEADIAGTAVNAGTWIANTVERITGIALDNSSNDVPAFAGAKMLASLQCFEGGESSKKQIQGTENPKGGEPMPITYKEIQQAVRDMNIMPHQLFSDQDVRNDRELGNVYTERDKFKTENETLKTENDANKTKLTEQDKRILQVDAKTRISKFIPEGATDKQKEYVAKNFDPEKLADLSDEGLKSFTDEQIKVYNENAAFFGDGKSTDNKGSGDNGENNENSNDNSGEEKSNAEEAFDDAMAT